MAFHSLRVLVLSSRGALVGEAEERDRAGDIRLRADVVGYPAAVREKVMGTRSPGGDQLVTDGAREGQIRRPLAVEMTELTPAQGELDAAKPVRLLGDAGPAEDRPARG